MPMLLGVCASQHNMRRRVARADTHLIVRTGTIRPFPADGPGTPSCCKLFVSFFAQGHLRQAGEFGVERLPDKHCQSDQGHLLVDCQEGKAVPSIG